MHTHISYVAPITERFVHEETLPLLQATLEEVVTSGEFRVDRVPIGFHSDVLSDKVVRWAGWMRGVVRSIGIGNDHDNGCFTC